MPDVVPFLMFCRDQAGKAAEALALYASAFDDAEILSVERGPDGVLAGFLRIGSQRVRVMDSSGPHEFGFTPAVSLFVECSSEAELRRAGEVLAGTWLMPIDDYGFSRLFGWVADPYGMTWQLNLAS